VTLKASDMSDSKTVNGRTSTSSVRKINIQTNYLVSIHQFLVIGIGACLAALGYSFFQVPFNLAAGGVSGISIIVNHFTGLPVGWLFFLINIPLLIIGFKSLGRWKFIVYTIFAVIVFSLFTEVFVYHLLPEMKSNITNNMLLSAVYAGLLVGVGSGLIYRSKATPGGTSIVGRIIQQKTGFPLSQVFLYVDGVIIILTVFIFGWEIALHALLIIFLSGVASDFVLEGPSTVRTAIIITDRLDDLKEALVNRVHRSISHWEITGGYEGKTHSMVLCTVQRPRVSELKETIAAVDPDAFIVFGVAHQTVGPGFQNLKR